MSEEESFKVTDRRGRGDLSSGAGAGSAEAAASHAAPDRDRAGGPQPNKIPAGAPPSDLGALFTMFASSALINLGAVPETDERRLDLGQAQAAIDVLLMLRDKTRGNRSEEESRLLEDILYDLQMRFVRAARRPSPASGP